MDDLLKSLGVFLLLLAIAFVAYFSAIDADFIWDDDNYVTQNYALRTAHGLCDIWMRPECTPQYYPLVHTTFWLEYQAWGLMPRGYHCTNIILHAINSFLLYRIVTVLRPPLALSSALVFLLHPVHAESVAWITERKNVLAGAFFLAAIYSNVSLPIESQTAAQRAKTLFLFVCALLSKTVAVSLPVVLLIIVYWKEGRVTRRNLTSVLPMIAIGLPFAANTIWLERVHVGAAGPEWDLTFCERIRIAGHAYWFYLQKLIWPAQLAFIYPKWDIESVGSWLFPLAAVVVLVASWVFHRKNELALLLYYSACIFPALGLINIYPMRYTWAADHYQYLASIGPILWMSNTAMHAANFVLETAGRQFGRGVVAIRYACLSLVLMLLGFRTTVELEKYANRESLWVDTLAKDPQCEMAWVNLGMIYRDQYKKLEAGRCFNRAMQLSPDDATPAINLASLLATSGATDAATKMYQELVNSNKRGIWLARYNLAVLLLDKDNVDEADSLLQLAVQEAPRESGIHNLRGLIAMRRGNFPAAADHFQLAIKYSPYFFDAKVNLGAALKSLGKNDLAKQQWNEVLSIDPQHNTARHNLRHE